jgi:Regulator of chromosome condensation (RCC1) repeat
MTLADIPYEILTGSLLETLDVEGSYSLLSPILIRCVDILHLGTTSRYFRKVAFDEHFWRQRTLNTFRLPPQPIRQTGWSELYKRLSTAKVFTWGFNEFGRLGHSYSDAPRTIRTPLYKRKPMEVASLRNEVVVDLGCGGWSTWALTSTGKVYGWGKVDLFLCGLLSVG